MSRRALTLSLLLPLTLLSAGCAIAVGDDEPALEAGTMQGATFSAFRAGDSMNVLTAVQTGLWLMPTVRYQGFVGEPSIRCTAIDLDKNSFLSEGAAHTDLNALDGWMHLAYNMPVTIAEEDMDDLVSYEGDRVLFQCRADDEAGNSLAVAYDMILHVQ